MQRVRQFGIRRSPWQRFRSEEAGTATVEGLLWLPIFFGLLVLAADVSMIFHNQARMLRVVQDANRSFSVGRLSSAEETEDRIRTAFSAFADDLVVQTTVTSGLITTRLSIPARDLDIIGLSSTITGATVTVVGEHFVEY